MRQYVHWSDLTQLQKDQVKQLRSDIPPWCAETMEYRFEYEKTSKVAGTLDLRRIAARHTRATILRAELILEAISPRKVPNQYPESGLSSCPTPLTTISD